MNWTIIGSVITGLLSLFGVYLANRKSAALVEYRLHQLEKKVDLHNNVVERVALIEAEDKRQNERLLILEEEQR